jgi:thiol-disulfide isomerase/thioredoxin
MIATPTACSNNNTAAEPGSATGELQTITNSEAGAPAPASTSPLPSFNIQDERGKQVNLQSFKGKKVFVNLWASWCPPYRREMPSIEKLAQSVDTGKVAFIMLSLDDTFDKAIKFAENQKLQLPIYYPAENLPLCSMFREYPPPLSSMKMVNSSIASTVEMIITPNATGTYSNSI